VSLYEAVFGLTIHGGKLEPFAQAVSFVSVLVGNRTADQAVDHFTKHGNEIMKVLEKRIATILRNS
jgi:hypothetical protein